MRWNFVIITISIFQFFLTPEPFAQGRVIVNLKDYGLRENINASPIIKKVLEKYKGQRGLSLVIPPGTYYLSADGSFQQPLYVSNATESDTNSKTRNIAFLIEGFKDLNIEGNGSLFLMQHKMVSFAIINSVNIRIKNLAFDMERPTMSELTVKKITPDSAFVSVHKDSKYEIQQGKIIFLGNGWTMKRSHTIVFNPVNETMRYGSFAAFEKAEVSELEPGQLVFKGDFSKVNLSPGDVLTVRDPYRDNCGAFISASENVHLEKLNMHYMHGLGIVAQFSKNLVYKLVKVAPRTESGRTISSFADCFHFSGCAGKILIDSCFTSGSHDDPVNVHGTHLSIVDIYESGKFKVKFMHHQTYGFNAFHKGDSIAFVDPASLQYLGKGKLTSARMINEREMELGLNASLPPGVQHGSLLENLTWTPEITIRNSRFERTNTRGLLVTTRRKVLVENNIFYKTGMHGVLIADDGSSWFESGPVTDVLIRNNVFEQCGYNQGNNGYVINIAPENHKFIDKFFVHKNIRIVNNIFKVSVPPLLYARSVQGLVFANNVIQPSGNVVSNGVTPIILTGCAEVDIKSNLYSTPWKELIEKK